jgi:hypothetical protein
MLLITNLIKGKIGGPNDIIPIDGMKKSQFEIISDTPPVIRIHNSTVPKAVYRCEIDVPFYSQWYNATFPFITNNGSKINLSQLLLSLVIITFCTKY